MGITHTETVAKGDSVSSSRWNAKHTNVKTKGIATFIVAASDSPDIVKENADYLCDGTADEVQINAAMVSANSINGGIVSLTSGSYTIADTISIPDNITLQGEGRSTVLNFRDGGDKTMITNSNATPLSRDSTGNFNIIIKDMYINGNKGGNSGSGTDDTWCVGFSTVENLRIENLIVIDGWTAAIRAEFCKYVIISNNIIRYSGDDSIAINKQSNFVSCYGNNIRDTGFDRTFEFTNGSGETAWVEGHVLTAATSKDPSAINNSACTIESISIDDGTSFAGNDASGTVTVSIASQSGLFAASETLTSGTGGATGEVVSATKEYGAPYGIEIQDAVTDVTCFGNTLWNCQEGGITVQSHIGEGSTVNISISSNTIKRCFNAIKIDGKDAEDDIMKDVAIISNVISEDYYTTNAAAFLFNNTENIVVFGNNIRTTAAGIRTGAWNENLSITGNNFVNTLSDGTRPGMHFKGPMKHCVVRDNLIKDFQFQGIDFTNSSNSWGFQITNNSIVGCDRSGSGRCIQWEDPTNYTVLSFNDNGGSPDTLTIAGDRTVTFYVGSNFTITGSNGNDGTYTVTDVSFSSVTTISVATGSWSDEVTSGVVEAAGRNCVLAGNYFEGDFWSRDTRDSNANNQLPAQGGWAETWPNINDTG